ncbi:AAA family ATPase [Nocardiopsis sp. RSe5-2]|uniref:AAA family ATPase n=1 Tax=Nocardiopsis endophytica TaxID=3018445 RepID=A0ABT4UBF7_9ACTN|nr:helix-turn-helix transcriptional regulator [Nocardiopsis endophytica]MDA2814238.1 AAA family ATPase [Nocardiopsis endophytica]
MEPESTERARELEELIGLLQECERGAGRIAMVMGPPGFGKTRLLNAFAARVAGAGVPLVTVSCTRADRAVDLGAVRQIAHGLGRDRDAPCLLGPEAAHLTWEALAARAADRGALVVVIDDAQHADPRSLEVIDHIAHRLRGSRILLVPAVGESPGGGRVLADLEHHPLCRRLRLAPITVDEAARIGARVLGAPIGAADAERVHRTGGGSPLLTQSLLEDMRDAGAPGAAPRTYAASVAVLLHRLGDGPVRAARASAALGRASGPAAVAELLGVDVPAADRTLGLLDRAGLTEEGVLRHPAARDAVREGMDPRERCVLDTRAAHLLHRVGAPAADVAEVLLSGADTGADWVPGLLREAADHALAAGDPRRAARYLRTAADLDGDVGTLLALARAEWRSSPAAAAAVPPPRPLRGRTLPPEDLGWLVELALWHGDRARADEAHRALEKAARGGAEAARVLGAVRLWTAATHPDAALNGDGDGDGTCGAVAALAGLLRSGEVAGGADRTARLLRSEPLDTASAAEVEAAVTALVHAEREEEAEELARGLQERAERRGSATWTSVLGALRARAACRRGDLPEAVRFAQESLERVPPRGLGVFAAVPLAALVAAHTGRGQLEEAERCLYHPLAPTALRTRYGLDYLAARGAFGLAAGRPRAALEDFRACGERMRAWRMDTPALLPWRTGAAEALAALGDREGARALIEEQRALPAPRSARVRAGELAVLAETREVHLRPPLLREAVDLLRDDGAALDQSRALARLALALSALGESDRARAFAEQADRLAERCGAVPVRRSVADVLRGPETPGVSGEVPDADGLSPTERRVAALAALGYTNREISRKAHVTVSTVEQHLTRAYRKLGVRGRAELSPALTTVRPAPHHAAGTAERAPSPLLISGESTLKPRF